MSSNRTESPPARMLFSMGSVTEACSCHTFRPRAPIAPGCLCPSMVRYESLYSRVCCGPHQILIGKRDTKQSLTELVKLRGQPSMLPRTFVDQSKSLINSPQSPPLNIIALLLGFTEGISFVFAIVDRTTWREGDLGLGLGSAFKCTYK
jgi:hypothetical protein